MTSSQLTSRSVLNRDRVTRHSWNGDRKMERHDEYGYLLGLLMLVHGCALSDCWVSLTTRIPHTLPADTGFRKQGSIFLSS